MAVLAIRTPEDGLLGALAPLGLGAAAGTALVVDLDPAGPRFPGDGSLAQLVADGPRRSDLTPTRAGLAVLRNGGIDDIAAREVLDALGDGWPAVVLRLPPGPHLRRPDIEVRPLVPGGVFPAGPGAVYQDLGFRIPAPGPLLPTLSRATAGALLAGSVPRRSRWVRAWARGWDGAWG
jgi:hypothetical protein